MKFGALSGFPQLTKSTKIFKISLVPRLFTCVKGLWDEVNFLSKEPGDIDEATFILP